MGGTATESGHGGIPRQDIDPDGDRAARRRALGAYLALDGRLCALEQDAASAAAELADRRAALGAALREFVPLAEHLADPDVLLPPLQMTLARVDQLAGLIEAVHAAPDPPLDLSLDPAMVASVDDVAGEAVVAAGIWLEEALSDSGWIGHRALVLAAQAAGIDPVALEAATVQLVAVEIRQVDGVEEWRLAIEGAFELSG